MVAARLAALRLGASDAAHTTVVANADDPLVVWGAQGAAQVVWVAAGQLWRQDAVGCPACTGRIVFADGRLVVHVRVPPSPSRRRACAATSSSPPTVVTFRSRLALPGRCNLANAAMAAVAAGVLGCRRGRRLGGHGRRSPTSREGSPPCAWGATSVRLLLAKNPAGWAELLDLLEGGTDPVVIGINARIADGHDPSWLWDVPFERLAGRLVVATGERCRDLAVRLRHAGVAHVTVPDDLEALRAAASSHGASTSGNYTAFQDAAPPPRLGRVPDRPSPGALGLAHADGRRGDPGPGDAGGGHRGGRPGQRAAPPPGAIRRGLRRCGWWWSTPTCSAPTATAATGGCWPGGPCGATSRSSSIHAPSDAPLPGRGRRLLPRRWRGRSPGAVGGATARRGARRCRRRRCRGVGGVRRLPGDRAVLPRCRRPAPSGGGPARRGHGEGLGAPRRGGARRRADPDIGGDNGAATRSCSRP